MFEPGNKVLYNGQSVQVLDVAFRLNGEFTSVLDGASLEYYVKSSSGGEWWADADLVTSERDDPFFGQDDRSPELMDRGYNMVAWSDGLEDRPDNSKLPEIVTLLMAIQYDKEGSYGSSWKGKGEYRGIMANIDRKYDRLDKMTDSEIEGSVATLNLIEEGLRVGRLTENEVGESKVDAIADLANYCLLYMTYVKENFPKVFAIWVEKNVPIYLRDKIPFI